ncbi:MAG: TrmH family RNA methyltransferase [Brevinema sp.]
MIVYGRNSIEEALNEGLHLSTVWFDAQKGDKYPGLRRMVRDADVPMKFISEKEMDKLSGTQKHQGVIAEMPLPANIITEDMIYESDYTTYKRVLMLDGVTDTGNLGAIMRSAVLLGAQLLLLPKDNSARITPQTVRSSAGALYKLPTAYVDNLKTEIEAMKSQGFSVIALDGASKEPLESTPNDDAGICLILGSEREGIRKGIKNLCTHRKALASTKLLDSFNVSVAAAIAMQSLWHRHLKI